MYYGYTTIGVKPEYRNLLNEVTDYHGLTVSKLLPMLITAYAFMQPEGREAILDIGSKIVAHINAGMPIIFDDSLEVSEACLKGIIDVKTDE